MEFGLQSTRFHTAVDPGRLSLLRLFKSAFVQMTVSELRKLKMLSALAASLSAALQSPIKGTVFAEACILGIGIGRIPMRAFCSADAPYASTKDI